MTPAVALMNSSSQKPSRKPLLLAAAAFAVLGLANSASAAPATAAKSKRTVKSFQGRAMGGQQPVAKMTLQLYQAGGTGYGSAATTLGPSVQTTTSGNFTFPSYTCDSGSQVYLIGTKGQPIAATGNTPAVTNNNLALMVGLGTCGGTDLMGFINMNEITTVASVWALAPFMTGIANLGSDSTNTAGLDNAFAVINEVVNTANGAVSGPSLPVSAVLPIAEIDTLADLIAQCVNSGGGTAGDGSACGNLFSLAPDSTGTVYPTDSLTAALNIAHNPGRNVPALYALLSSPVFTPTLSSSPNDWTIAITYSGGGLSTPTAIATDAAGSVWVTNSGNSSVTKLDYSGNALSTSSGFTAGSLNSPSAIAIDANGNAWVANAGNNTISLLNPTGTTGTVYSNNGLSKPASIAIDGSGNVWVANSGSSANSVSAFTSTGSALTRSPFTGAGLNAPVSVAITPK